MSELYLTDVVIRCLSGRDNLIPNGARLFVVVGNKVGQVKQFANEPMVPSWRLNESIRISDKVSSMRLTVMTEYPLCSFHQLGFVDLVKADIILQCTGKNEPVRMPLRTSYGPPLELVCHCEVTHLEQRPNIFEDTIEEEAIKREASLARSWGPRLGRLVADVKYEHVLSLSDESKPPSLMRAGNLLFQTSQKDADLDKAITLCETLVRLTPDGHQCQAEFHSMLGIALLHRNFNDITDIDRAISAHERAVHLTPEGHADKPTRLSNLGNSFTRRFECAGNLVDIDKAVSAHKQALHLTPEGDADKPARLNNLSISFTRRFEHSGDLVDIDKAISAHEQALHLTPEGHADKPACLNNLGSSFLRRFQRSGALVDIDKAIPAHERATHLTPEGYACKPARLNHIGNSFACRFERSGDLGDIDKAISAYKQALHLTPEDHANKPAYLNNLGNSFARQFERSGDLVDIDRAISAHEQALHLTPEGHADKPARLNDIGNSFACRFERSGDLVDIDKAISAHERAIHLTPEGHGGKPIRLKHLGNCFLCRFEHAGDPVDIDKAISAHEQALHLTPEGHADKAACLSDLGNSFTRRFEHSGDLVDIDKAISVHEQAIHLTPEGHACKPARLSNLGSSFLRRFERAEDLGDIDKAISAHKQALHLTPEGHADKPAYLNNLGNSFACRFNSSGDLVDIDKAISAHEQATHFMPEGPGYLNNLGNSFACRFEHSGGLVDIDKAISAHQRAVHHTPEGHADKPVHLNNLGNSFLRRFQRSGDFVDIDRAISAHERAVLLTPEGHANKPAHLSNLGNSFTRRFECAGDLVDNDKAISAHEQAIHLTPDGHAGKSAYLNNLGNSFLGRFTNSGGLVDIDKAISAHKQALHLTPDSHANKPGRLNNLGNSFLRRFEHSGDLVDIDKAISAYEQATHFTPEGHAGKPAYLNNLGNSFLRRFNDSGDLVYRSAAVTHFRSAATCSYGPPSFRFGAALRWARLASTWQISSALQGYIVAFDLLPQVTWIGQTIQARHSELTSLGVIVSEAAAVAISAGCHDTALEILEQGRSVVWNQLLQLRTPVDALREVQPTLANDLLRVSKALEQASSRGMDIHNTSTLPLTYLHFSMEEIAQGHRRLAEEWEMLVQRARGIPGFEDFLRPKKLRQLFSAADSGPVVVVNVHKLRCDALVLMTGSDDVMHIPLDHLSYKKAQKMQQLMNELLITRHLRARDIRAMKHDVATTTGTSLSSILSDLWSCVVKPVLDCLAMTTSHIADPPRIWWCATGPLAFLPIHAAGIYDNGMPGSCISDYVVSSYTPTLNTLIISKDHKTRRTFRGLLAVGQPNTPGQSALPSTMVELTQIQQRARHIGVHTLQGPEASVQNVVLGMESHSWVHFACHAIQDAVEPTKSSLCLHDGRLELSAIITKSFPHADLAFLSACQTAMGDEKLSEEAVHLAAGLMLAGYRSVIATMWSIKDQDAPVVSDHIYSHLLGDAELEPDSTKAAVALHRAVKQLRQQVGDSAFLSWVPFIHVGL